MCHQSVVVLRTYVGSKNPFFLPLTEEAFFLGKRKNLGFPNFSHENAGGKRGKKLIMLNPLSV